VKAFRVVWLVRRVARYDRGEILFRAKQHSIKALDLHPFLRAEAGAAHADDVQTAQFVGAVHDRIRWQILADGRTSAHDRHRANAAKLVDQAVGGDERAIICRDMAAQSRPIGDDD